MSLGSYAAESITPLPFDPSINYNPYWAENRKVPVYFRTRHLHLNMAVLDDGTIRGYSKMTDQVKLFDIFMTMAVALTSFTDRVAKTNYTGSLFPQFSNDRDIPIAIKNLRTGFYVCYNHRRKVYARLIKITKKKPLPKNCQWKEGRYQNYVVFQHFKHRTKKRSRKPKRLYLMLSSDGRATMTTLRSWKAQFTVSKVKAPELIALRIKQREFKASLTESSTIPPTKTVLQTVTTKPTLPPTTTTIPSERLKGCARRRHPIRCMLRRQYWWLKKGDRVGKRKRYCKMHRKRYRRRMRKHPERKHKGRYFRLCVREFNITMSPPPTRHRLRRSLTLLQSLLQTT